MPTLPGRLPLFACAAAVAGACLALADNASAQMPAAISAPVTDVHYDVTVDSATVALRRLSVVATMTVTGPGPLVLSLPAWTPGAYEMSWYARWVSEFAPTADGRPLTWDKVDYETWRIETGGAKTVRVAFTYEADSLDNAMSWTRADFALFNGTNIFLYPEGRGLNFAATVAIHTSAGWLVATGMAPGAAPGTYTAPTYHDLVDMPFFVGRFDLDSIQVGGRWVRYASYPAGSVAGSRRATFLKQIGQAIPAEGAVFGEVPWTTYTVMQITDTAYGGGASGLEHQNSHVDIVGAGAIDNPFMPGLFAHEIFHSWNVKRMRPAEMVPYRYDVTQPTPWLWVSEGITDYYADLAQVRGGVIDEAGFYRLTSEKIGQVAAAPPVALTDASLSTWIHPTDGTGYLYYPKGSLAGFMLDVLIRDASDNQQSLDAVMRSVYAATYKKGRGFTGSDWWGAVSRAAGGKSFAEFNRRYVDGRDPFPWDSILPLAGLRAVADSVREPRLGVATAADSNGARITQVLPGSAAAEAGVQPGDVLTSLADIPVTDADFGKRFRARYAGPAGASATTVRVVVRRGSQTLTLQAPLRFSINVVQRIEPDPQASPKAVRVRTGILKG